MKVEVTIQRYDGVITTMFLKEVSIFDYGIKGINNDYEKIFIPYSSILYYVINE